MGGVVRCDRCAVGCLGQGCVPGVASRSSTVFSVVPLVAAVVSWSLLGGGVCVVVNRRSSAVCQGQASGGCGMFRRADRARRAGIVMRVRRIVAVVALASRPA